MKTVLFISILIVCSCPLLAQECPGGLGENLFVEGDFGTGFPNVLAVDPEIAPGYLYTTQGPPDDGEYLITNDLNRWPFNFGTWLSPQDNSSDPNGYMMVVNASFDPGLFYDELVEGLCDNTTYEFSADIMNLIMTDVPNHIDPNIDFLIDDEVVLGTGDIPKNERWNTFSFSFNTVPGQTSVNLSLRNNAPGGIGNDLALDNISFRACGPRSEPAFPSGNNTVCQEAYPIEIVAFIDGVEDLDRNYEWEISLNGVDGWTSIPDQNSSRLIQSDVELGVRRYFRFATAASQESFLNEKCRFFSDTISVYTPIREFSRTDTICGGTSINIAGTELINPGVYVEPLISSVGCDSIVIIFLDTVLRDVLFADISAFDPSCTGEDNGIIEATNVSGGFPPYHINIGDREYPGLTADDLVEGDYDILIEDRFNCFTRGEASLSDPPRFEIEIGEDQELILGEELTITTTSNADIMDIVWPEQLSEYDGSTQFTFLPINNLQVRAEATSTEGCEAQDEISIILDTDVSIYIPNIFSPNNDGVEDEFFISPFGRSLGDIFTFNIYDRWGGLVWSATEGGKSWDGTMPDGDSAIEGLYTFYLEAALINGDPIRSSGSLLLMR